MELNAKLLVGFGISNAETYQAATTHSKGAIIGSAFIKHLEANGANSVADFISQIR
jgi:tryptophan synthase alpha chain